MVVSRVSLRCEQERTCNANSQTNGQYRIALRGRYNIIGTAKVVQRTLIWHPLHRMTTDTHQSGPLHLLLQIGLHSPQAMQRASLALRPHLTEHIADFET